MQNHGKSIRLFLRDRNVTQIKFVELFNWTIQALVCPRSRVVELKNWLQQAQRPGVYVLFDIDKIIPETGKPPAYIGESEDVFGRLTTHINNKKGFDFKEVILFTSKDENINKAHVRYLESKLYSRAIVANRYTILNSQEPNESPLSLPDREAMDEFAENIYLIMGSLGRLIFEPEITSETKNKSEFGNLHFKLQNSDIHATGSMTDEGFLVFKGSTAAGQAVNSLQGSYKVLRDNLIKDGILKPSDGKFIFEKDHAFSSPSAAATVVAGSSRNGGICWKDETGKLLVDIEAGKIAGN